MKAAIAPAFYCGNVSRVLLDGVFVVLIWVMHVCVCSVPSLAHPQSIAWIRRDIRRVHADARCQRRRMQQSQTGR